MTFDNVASALIRHQYAREVDIPEALDLLQLAYDHNLVQFGENVRNSVSFICNCCGCCCEALIAQRRFSLMQPIHTTGFLPVVDQENCNGCGKCVEICPVEALSLVSANDFRKPKMKKASLAEELCIGCGLCQRNCKEKAISLSPRSQRVITPLNTVHRVVLMAIERGKLQDLIFDNRLLFSHRAMAAIFSAILNLPPIKQILASRQVKSRYLLYLINAVKV